MISAFYRIFGHRFERLKQLIFRENEKNIGKPTVDLWRLKMAPWRHTNPGGGRTSGLGVNEPTSFFATNIVCTLGHVYTYRDRVPISYSKCVVSLRKDYAQEGRKFSTFGNSADNWEHMWMSMNFSALRN